MNFRQDDLTLLRNLVVVKVHNTFELSYLGAFAAFFFEEESICTAAWSSYGFSILRSRYFNIFFT